MCLSLPIKWPGASLSARCWGIVLATMWGAANASIGAPLRIHPENGRYFEINGRAGVLVGSSEHYGAVIHTGFDYIRYLDEVRACGLNYLRVFSGTYREVDGSFNIEDNTLAPPMDRLKLPWLRTEEAGAQDGGNKLDLDRWNPAYFHRLRDFFRAAEERGIFVQLSLFCPYYDDVLWDISPMNAANHVNSAGASGRESCFLPDGDLLPYQKAFARKCVMELRDFGNVILEVMNEPYQGNVPAAWEELILDEIGDAIADDPHPPLVARNVANRQGVITSTHPLVSIYNFHYALPAAALANQGLGKVIGNDETGSFFFPANQAQLDFPYRREAWEFMLSGGALQKHLDYSFTAAREDGLAAQDAPGGGGPAIRRQLGILRWFMDALPLGRCSPQTNFVASGIPAGGAARAFGAAGETYAVYLRGGTQATLGLNLPAGTWSGRWIDPRSGRDLAGIAPFTHPGGVRTAQSPVYAEDVLLHFVTVAARPPSVTVVAPIYQSVVPSDGSLTVSAEAAGGGEEVSRVEFFMNGVLLGQVETPPYEITVSAPSLGSHLIQAKVVAADGSAALSQPVKCRVAGPHQVAVNLNGTGATVHGKTWLAQTDATSAGMTLANFQSTTTPPAVTIYPNADPAIASMLGSQIARPNTSPDPALRIAMPMPDGLYDVYFSLIEGQTAYSRDVRVIIEDEVVARGIGDQALGEWVNYGPYRTSVADGTLDLRLERESKGTPKIANFSVYRVEPVVAPDSGSLRMERHPGLLRLTWPEDLGADRVEHAIDPGADVWMPLDLPVAEFSDRHELLVPFDRPRRFFRMRID